MRCVLGKYALQACCGKSVGEHNLIEFEEAKMEAPGSRNIDNEDGKVDETIVSMGYSRPDVEDAMEACGCVDVPLIIDYIAAKKLQASDGAGPSGGAAAYSSNAREARDRILAELVSMDYSVEAAQDAIQVCGTEARICDLIDHIAAKELEAAEDADYTDAWALKDTDDEEDDGESEDEDSQEDNRYRKAMKTTEGRWVIKKARQGFSRGQMTGFGIPETEVVPRLLTPKQSAPPFFFFENVSSTPAGEWEEISSLLYNIEPEFLDAKHFSVCRRPRGYVHNLPLHKRSVVRGGAPKTIREFFPASVPFIPPWDTRSKLNCINTVRSSTTSARRIRDILKRGEPSDSDKKTILELCRKWNLVWTGPGVTSQLEPHEVERALGFPVGHTRGAITSTEQAKSLGNSFQVDTVGYQLSVLKPFFPDGIRVLSLFAGIGGAEVALHRACIPLKFVVSVELNRENREILDRWWNVSGQRGKHIILDDVRSLSRARLEMLMAEAGGPFDLLIGGSPCNNLSGNNRRSRTGLQGEESSLFYEYPRILEEIKAIMRLRNS